MKLTLTPKLLLLLLLSLCGLNLSAQDIFRVMFYNVENLFHPSDESGKDDEEFTPEGLRRWNNYRYYRKLNNIAKVITAVGEWETPALVGLCEIENEQTIEDLTAHSLLRQRQYRYVLTESPDARGIDVALLYQRDRFRLIAQESIRIKFPKNPQKRTRDLLHVSGQVISGDTVDVFVCHFPSRRGGQAASEPDRLQVAKTLRAATDSLLRIRSHANIVMMGDFNDEPTDRSMLQLTADRKFYNLFAPIAATAASGSYRFQGEWNFIDQIFVSSRLLDRQNNFHVIAETAQIFQADFLLTNDASYGGKRPFKTFNGVRYEGGYSDHLPVFVDFVSMSATGLTK
ncbi:MAG: endonuclease [Candidatus Symbiothrix sp.]|jgi:predicted extracellular nuclease|nr:endonuclease [Candidatus Symbiothrix sp.]